MYCTSIPNLKKNDLECTHIRINCAQRFQGRTDLLKYAAENGIPIDMKNEEKKAQAPYSMDANLMHIRYTYYHYYYY